MSTNTLLKQAEKFVQRASPEEQRWFLADLPHLLHLDYIDLSLLKLAEHSFDFWNNPDDIVYDSL